LDSRVKLMRNVCQTPIVELNCNQSQGKTFPGTCECLGGYKDDGAGIYFESESYFQEMTFPFNNGNK